MGYMVMANGEFWLDSGALANDRTYYKWTTEGGDRPISSTPKLEQLMPNQMQTHKHSKAEGGQ